MEITNDEYWAEVDAIAQQALADKDHAIFIIENHQWIYVEHPAPGVRIANIAGANSILRWTENHNEFWERHTDTSTRNYMEMITIAACWAMFADVALRKQEMEKEVQA